jgi:hypothetical protein
LTATGVAASEDNTRLFEVGAESWPDEEFVEMALLSACLAVERFDDCDCDALAFEEPAE